MAKIEFGPLVSSVRGAVGGVTFRGAGNRASVCIKSTPARSRSQEQTANTVAMSRAFQGWASLNPSERLAWYWYGVSLGEARRGRVPDSMLAQSTFLRWASAHALCGTMPPIGWPLYALIDPPALSPFFIWDDSPASTGSAFVFIREEEPVGACVWLSPLRASTGRPRGRRVQVWNTAADGGTFVPSLIGPPYAWKLQIGTRAWDLFAGAPTGTVFAGESTTILDTGAIFRQILPNTTKTTS